MSVKKPAFSLALGVEDFALCCEIDKLARDPEYSKLKRHNLKVIVEARAGQAITAPWDKLPQDVKMCEMRALRVLRESRYSNAFWSRVVSLLLASPLVILADMPDDVLTKLEGRIKASHDAEELEKLKTDRKAITGRIRKLKKAA